eukprot:jgi/Tetstr1/455315/TSEL_042150.t1
MSKLWRKDGTTVEITRVTPAAGGGESHHSIFGWADDTKETAKTEQSTSQQFYGALAADARIVPAAGVPLCKQDFKLSDGYRQELAKTGVKAPEVVEIFVNAAPGGELRAGIRSTDNVAHSKQVSQPPGGKSSLTLC